MPDFDYRDARGLLRRVKDVGSGVMADLVALVTVAPALPLGSDKSGTITAGGTAQTMAVANASRQSLTGQNISTADLWISENGTAAAPNAAGSYKVPSGSAFSVATQKAISVYGATTGQAWTATET